ncbi:MAG: hypothetical protein VX992_00170, partial [Acidobacteriota bacterium]|nr:hypothetical protein [Acidobacteriota bacterium]
MSLSAILFLFLTHLGIGIAWTLILVPRSAGVKFFRFNAGLVVAILVAGMAFRPDAAVLGGVASGTGFITLSVATGAFLVYWATIGRVMVVLRRGLLWVGLAAGAVTLTGAVETRGRLPAVAVTAEVGGPGAGERRPAAAAAAAGPHRDWRP